MHLSPVPVLRRGAAAAAGLAAALTLLAPAAVAGAAPAAAHGTAAAAPARAAAATDATWSVAPANNKIGSDRPHFTYTLPQGTRVTDAIVIANHGDAPITLRLYASDAFTTDAGGLDLLPAGKKPTDVGAWTKPRTGTVTLAPQQTRTVPFTVTVPSDATPGDHTGGIVTSLVTKNGGGKVALDRRLGSRIYLRVPGVLTPAAKVASLHAHYDGSANPVGSGATRITYTVTNTGNVRLTARQKVGVSGLFGALTGAAALPDLPELLPGDSLTRSFAVRGVWPAGRLRVTVSLTPRPVAAEDPAGQQPTTAAATASASATAWAWPWASVLTVLVLAAACYGGFRLRRRNKRKVAAAIEKAVSDALSTTAT